MPKRWQQEDGLHLDLRGLHPPEPLITILSEIDGGAKGSLILHMDRDPVLLYPELEERGWSAERLPAEGETLSAGQEPVTLILRPDSDA